MNLRKKNAPVTSLCYVSAHVLVDTSRVSGFKKKQKKGNKKTKKTAKKDKNNIKVSY